MTSMEGLLSSIYQITQPQLVRAQCTEEVFFTLLFARYAAAYSCSESTVSRFFKGKRNITRKFLRLYMNPDSAIPHCPTLLYLDISSFMNTTLTWADSRAKLQGVLDAFLGSIPAADAARILDIPCYIVPDSTHASTVLLARAIWYAVCQDMYI